MSNKPETQSIQQRDVNAANRAAMAVKLRSQKVGYDDIARMCGYGSRGAAYKAVMRELQRVVVKDVERLREEELESLEQLELECWKRLQDKEYAKSKLFAVDRIIAIKERRARLMGLDIKPDDNNVMPQIIIQEVPMNYLEGPKE